MLQTPLMNKEFLVVTGHQPVTNSLLLFVHTARRSYRLGSRLRLPCANGLGCPGTAGLQPGRQLAFLGIEVSGLEEGEVVTRYP